MLHTPRPTPFERRTATLCCALALGMAGSAAAQNAPAPGKASDQELATAFTSADKDRDKALSPFEARRMQAIATQFARFDSNKDGFLSLDEYMAAAKAAQPGASKLPAKK